MMQIKLISQSCGRMRVDYLENSENKNLQKTRVLQCTDARVRKARSAG